MQSLMPQWCVLHLIGYPTTPHSLIVSFYFSDTERTTIIIIHHTIVRVEPDPMTAIQGREQRPSDSLPAPVIDGRGTTQTLLTGGLQPAVTLPSTRRPPLVPHKATGDATTQTRTTNVLRSPTKTRDA